MKQKQTKRGRVRFSICLPTDLGNFVLTQADKDHFGNVSHFFREITLRQKQAKENAPTT